MSRVSLTLSCHSTRLTTAARVNEVLDRMRDEAVPVETRVRMVHPDWDDIQVRNEVRLIREDACQHPYRVDVTTHGDAGLTRYVCPGCGEQWTERRPA
jgi:DNA-directed RNA polymerase subunit M/transcription elongation factor TFIIS